jgi:hypothetical protein
MRKFNLLLVLMVVISIASANFCFAQILPGDSSSQQSALSSAVTLYNTSIGEESGLYNGPEYYSHDPTVKGNAYFMDVNAFASGAVYYDGSYYRGVPMLYDLYDDAVVVLLYNHFTKYSLLKYRVKSFDFLGHHFININTDTIDNKAGLKSGYYDQLYNGKSEILAKRSKSIQTNSAGTMGADRYFSPDNDFYLRKNHIYYKISGQRELLSALQDKKKELQQYIKANQIKFRSNPEEAMVKIATYYDHLTQ